jgi:hypothetical protein
MLLCRFLCDPIDMLCIQVVFGWCAYGISLHGKVIMKLTLPQNLICCSLNEDTIDPFILAMSGECYQSHDQEAFLLPVQT